MTLGGRLPAVVVFPRPTFALLRFGARKVMPETHLHLGCSDLVIACLSRDVYASNHIGNRLSRPFTRGCYEVDKPIITRDIAIEVPGLNGDVLSSNGAAVGFADTPSFSHAFKRVFGLPPSRARRDFAGL